MPRATTLLRLTALLGVAAVAGACTKASPGGVPSSAPASGLPSISSVSGSRFTTAVDLDDGGLVVAPPGKARPQVSAGAAGTIFRSADVVAGDYRFALLGLGVVTIADDITSPTSSTTVPSPTTSAGATSISPSTSTPVTSSTGGATSTTARPVTTTTTTTVAGTTTTSAPSSPAPGSTTTSGPPPAPLAHYDGRLAWVGIVWGPRCGSSPSTTTTTAARQHRDAYVAVVIDAETGRDVVAYTSRGVAGCGGTDQEPHARAPDELLSVAWTVVGPSSTAVTVTVPACGSYYGWTDVPTAATTTLQVIARRPFDGCPTTAATTQTVDSVVPLGGAQNQVQHAPLGPVAELHTLSGG